MTEPQATSWCKSFMGKSAGFNACQTIPKINSGSAVKICVLDILVSYESIYDLCRIFLFGVYAYSVRIYMDIYKSVLLLKATNTTIFASAPRESVKAQCLTEISQNETLRNFSENGENIAQKIKTVSCPGECSDHGVCENGEKSLCNLCAIYVLLFCRTMLFLLLIKGCYLCKVNHMKQG